LIQFYAPDIQQTFTLPDSDSGHAVRVLRMKEGDTLQVVDGRGNIYTCRIVEAHPKHTVVDVLETLVQPRHWPCDIELAVAPTKHIDRMEWLVEKAVELGIDRITPLRCVRSERKEIKVERLTKIAVSAMKQSLKATLPRIDAITPFADYLAENFVGQKFFCYCNEELPRQFMTTLYNAPSAVRILIGPEGDFSPEEAQEAISSGYDPVSLGDCRLRTETAAVYAVAQIHTLLSVMQK